MNWTKTPPTVEGYYWVRSYQLSRVWRNCVFSSFPDVTIVLAKQWSDGVMGVLFMGQDLPFPALDFERAEWYGPLEAPAD